MKAKQLLALFALWALAVTLRPERAAFAATAPVVFDQKLCTGSAASTGGTMTCDYATTTDRVHRVVASVGMSSLSAAHLTNAGFLTCEGIFENKNGTVTFATALSSSNNPTAAGTTTFVASHAQALDAAFVGAGPSTCGWTVSGTNARVTVTNLGATTADVTVGIQVFSFGSQ